MCILQRYIIRKHVGPFMFGFFIITLLWLLNLLFTRLGHLLSRGLSIVVILEFFTLNLAWIMALALPMAALMACLMAFGRMAADNEITALKASGVSMLRAIAPVLFTAVLLCLFLIWFNNAVLPDANHQLALLMRDIHKKRPTISLEPGIIYREIPNINLMVQSIEEHENLSYVKGVLIHDRSEQDINKTIVAERGEIFVDEINAVLRLTLYDGEMHDIAINKMQEYRKLQFPRLVLTIPIPDMILIRSASEYRSDREQSAQMMWKEVTENNEAVKKLNNELNLYLKNHLEKFFPLLSATPESAQHVFSLTEPLIISFQENLQKEIRLQKNILNRINSSVQTNNNFLFENSKLLVEIHKKYSIPFACIVFVLIGAPLGIMTRRGGMGAGGGISLAFFLIYWSFLIGGEELADRRIISPFLSMWLANILVGGVGTYLVARVVKETSFIHFNNIAVFIQQRFRK